MSICHLHVYSCNSSLPSSNDVRMHRQPLDIYRAPSRYFSEHARPRANASVARASSSSCFGEVIGCRTPPTLILRSGAPPRFWECAHTQKERTVNGASRPSWFLLPERMACDVPLYPKVRCVVPKGTREDHRRHPVLRTDPRDSTSLYKLVV